MNESLPLQITLAQFLAIFRALHDEAIKRAGLGGICFITGSGTVVQSKVPMGRTLVERWLRDMYRLKQVEPGFEGYSFEEWLGIALEHVQGFKYESAANFLPYVYQERFRQSPQDGCREIDAYLSAAELSFGFRVLAHMATKTPHRIVISSYFDNFAFNAIASYAGEIPLVCGYESISRYIDPSIWKKPLVGKLQRDLLLAPKIGIEDIDALPEAWKDPLTDIFEHYTPVILGYGDEGGSGGNIMPFLKKLKPLKRKLYWLYREDSQHTRPAQEVQEIVKYLGGHLVPILGFDEIMLQLADEISLSATTISHEINERASRLVRTYTEQFLKLARSLSREPNGSGGSVTAHTTKMSAKSSLKRWEEDSSRL